MTLTASQSARLICRATFGVSSTEEATRGSVRSGFEYRGNTATVALAAATINSGCSAVHLASAAAAAERSSSAHKDCDAFVALHESSTVKKSVAEKVALSRGGKMGRRGQRLGLGPSKSGRSDNSPNHLRRLKQETTG